MTDANVRAFLAAVDKGEAGNHLKRSLFVSEAVDFVSWTDDDGFDALHHTILLNNAEAVQLLLSEGYFNSPYIPSLNTYGHFAARLGFTLIIGVLLQYRPDDFRQPSRKIRLPGEDVDRDDHVLKIPLDIAAEHEHIGCVRAILTQHVLRAYPEAPSKDDVTLVCLANCLSALKLVLKTKPSTADIKSGIEVSLKAARPQCLDLLLQQNVNISSMFKQMNLYHALYTYSATFSKDGIAILPQITSVLIKHGHSVNATSPPRTYPLYSLLSRSFCIDYRDTKHYIECMKTLLLNKADPYFDEVSYETEQLKRGVKAAVGRSAFTSALHCVFETVEAYASFLDSRVLAVRFVEECADRLAESYTSNTNRVGRRGRGNTSRNRGIDLHQYAKCSVVIGVDKVIMRCILRHGSDPNERINGRYAINTYIDMLFEKLSRLEVLDTHHKYKDQIDVMLELCMYMSVTSIQHCAVIFRRHHSNEISEQVKPYVSYIENELDKRRRVIRSLRRLSAWEVWVKCGMKASVVHAIPVSAKLKTDILPIS